jgi:beta-barrel assembly-enhancing protease
MEKKKQGTLSKVFASHPPIESRVAKIHAQTDKKLPPQLHYVMSTSELEDVKTRVAILENRGKVTDQDAPKKPTLRNSKGSPLPLRPPSPSSRVPLR